MAFDVGPSLLLIFWFIYVGLFVTISRLTPGRHHRRALLLGMLSHFELLLDLRLEGSGHKVGLLDNLHIVFGRERFWVGQLMLNFLGLVWCGSSEIVTFGDKDRCLTLLLGCR